MAREYKNVAVKIQLITNSFDWAVEPKLKWLSTWIMYLLLSVSLLLQNLHPSVITWSFEITRMIRLNNTLVTYWGCSFHFIIFEYPYFFGGFSADKNSAANSAIGGGLGSRPTSVVYNQFYVRYRAIYFRTSFFWPFNILNTHFCIFPYRSEFFYGLTLRHVAYCDCECVFLRSIKHLASRIIADWMRWRW